MKMNYKNIILATVILFGLGADCVLHYSSLNGKEKAPKSAVYMTASSRIDMSAYDFEELESGDTKILLFTRKIGGLNKEKIKKAVRFYWPRLARMLSVKTDEIAVVDYESPLGGGPLGNYAVGIYSSARINNELQTLVGQATGWAPRSSTKEYIDEHYSNFTDPEQAYIDDMVVHELGHTVFGFGKTQAPQEHDDWWFCFGLGLVYDRMLWKESQTKSSPLFDSPVEQWKNVFSQKARLDQRLIHPNTEKDREFGLSRFQVYGHGKAFVYLNALRQYIGPAEFDKIVCRYVSSPRTITYDDFLGSIPDRFKDGIKSLEKEFQVR